MAKVAYVTGGMGGIGTAICQRLHKEGFKVIAGCGPSRDFGKWLGEQKALGFTLLCFGGQRGRLGIDRRSVLQVRGRARTDRRAGEQRGHHARPHVPEDDARGLEGGDRHQPQQHVQRHQAGGAGHGREGLGPDHPDQLGQRREGPGRPDQLLGRQGRHARLHDGAGAGSGQQGRDGEHRESRATSAPTWSTPSSPQILEKIVETIPVKRLGTPDEIGSIVAWLAGPDSGFTTGADFSCNGGLHMG